MWEVVQTAEITRDMLAALFDNELCAIRVPGFAGTDACQLAMRGIEAHGVEFYRNIHPPIGKIGITQYEHMNSPEERREYFRKAAAANAARGEIFRESGDVLTGVISSLEQVWPGKVGLAQEEDTRETYFAGLVRSIPVALLHRDWAPRDARGWSVGRIRAQLTWNVYLQMSERGGTLVIYKRPYEEADETAKVAADNCAFSHCMVKGAEFIEILPERGELLLFNSRNYHSVERADGPTSRVTASSFIGRMPNDDLVFWS